MRTVIEVTQGDFLQSLVKRNRPKQAADWAGHLIAEMERKDATAKSHRARPFNRAKALSLELLRGKEAATYFTLKQLRDIEQPDTACYQSLVAIERKLTEIHEVKAIDKELIVTIHESPSHPLVRTLGLIGVNVDGRGSGLAYALQPVCPFEMTVDMREGLGQRLVHRSGGDPWHPAPRDCCGEEAASYFCRGTPVSVELALPRPLQLGCPECLGSVDDERSDRKIVTFARQKAREAVDHIDPQMVIESLLAHEWGRSNPEWLKEKRRLEKWLKELAGGSTAKARAKTEIGLISARIQELKGRPGSRRMKTLPPRLVARQFAKLSDGFAAADTLWQQIVADFGGLLPSGMPALDWDALIGKDDFIASQFAAIDALEAELQCLDALEPPILGPASGLLPEENEAQLKRLRQLTDKLAPEFVGKSRRPVGRKRRRGPTAPPSDT